MSSVKIVTETAIGGGVMDISDENSPAGSVSASLGLGFVGGDTKHKKNTQYMKDFRIDASGFLHADLAKTGELLLGGKVGFGNTYTNAALIAGANPFDGTPSVGGELNPFGFRVQFNSGLYAAVGPNALIIHDLKENSTNAYVGIRVNM